MSLLIYSMLLPSLILSVSLNYYLWPELLGKLAKQFFPDYERSIKIFHTSDPDFKCIHFMEKQKRRCRRPIIAATSCFAAMLRSALISGNWDDPLMPSMLHFYSQLCHCPTHQTTEKNVIAMAKRWETELKDTTVRYFFTIFFASLLLRHRSAEHFSAEAADELSEIDHSPLKHASTPQKPEMDPQSERLGTTRNTPSGNSTSSRQSSSPSTNSNDIGSNFRHYWVASQSSPVYSTITKRLDPDELKPGFVYILVHPTVKSLVKIGYSNELEKPEQRLEQWKAACKLDYKLYKLYTTKYAKRVESLVFSDLYKNRREMLCPACRKVHNEWFDIGPEEAERVVGYWVDWITTLAPYRGLILRHEFVRAMFLSVTATSGEQNTITDEMSRFLHDSSNRTWVDRTIILGRQSQKCTSPSETPPAVKTTAAKDASIEVQTILQNQSGDALSEPERPHSEPTCTTPPEETASQIPQTPEMALLPTPPDSKDKGVRRRLFSGTLSAEAKASSSALPPPANMTPSPSLSAPLSLSQGRLSEIVRDAEDTPSKARAVTEDGSGAKNIRRRNGAESSKMVAIQASPPDVTLSIAADNGKDQEHSERKAVQDKPYNRIDGPGASRDMLSPLRSPSPRVEPDEGLVSGAVPVESKPPQGTQSFRRKVSGVRAGTNRPTVCTHAQSAPMVSSAPREIIDLTHDDDDDSDASGKRRASAPPQILRTPPPSGSENIRTSLRRSALGKHIAVDDI